MTATVATFCSATFITITYGYEQNNFYCYTAEGKQAGKEIQQDCYRRYSLQHNMKQFPFFVFLFILNILAVLIVSLCYSSYVTHRVVDSTDNGHRLFVCKVFTAYIAQLFLRLLVLIVIICLQLGLYPVEFPAQLPNCPGPQTDHSPGLKNRTTGVNATMVPLQFYNCENDLAEMKSIFRILLLTVNSLCLALTFGEMVYLFWQACKDSTFHEDGRFCPDYLSSTTKEKPTKPQDQVDLELDGR